MSRSRVAADKRRVKFHTANCMVETWVQNAIAEIAKANDLTIKEAAETALTEFAERHTYEEGQDPPAPNSPPASDAPAKTTTRRKRK